MPKSNFSLESALTFIVSELPFPRQQFGGKVIIGNSNQYAELTLSIHGTDTCIPTMGQFKFVLVRYFLESAHSNSFSLYLADSKYKPKNTQTPGTGGYYWATIQDFYLYQPNLAIVTQDLTKILTFLNLPINP